MPRWMANSPNVDNVKAVVTNMIIPFLSHFLYIQILHNCVLLCFTMLAGNIIDTRMYRNFSASFSYTFELLHSVAKTQKGLLKFPLAEQIHVRVERRTFVLYQVNIYAS